MWWNLPTELVDQILSLLSIDDYVALCQVNSEAREVLDDSRAFQVVLQANFQKKLDEYDWNFPVASTKDTLWSDIGKLRSFLRTTKNVYPTSHLDELNGCQFVANRDSVIENAINTFASDPRFFLPLISELQRVNCTFKAEAEVCPKHPSTVAISEVAWLHKLLQLQNYLHAVNFFRNSDLRSKLTIEKCYFELSRCYMDFQSLAKYRVQKLNAVRKHVRSYFPLVASGTKFKGLADYKTFVSRLVHQILFKLDLNRPSVGHGGNVLRAYKGVGKESQHVYLSIVARIIQEEIFDKHSIFIGGQKVQPQKVYVTQMFMCVGPLYVSIDFESGVSSCYEISDVGRIHQSVSRDVVAPITIGEVLEQVFDDSESERHPISEIEQCDWTNLHFNTSIMKLRFLRTIMISVCEHTHFDASSFRPLMKHSDFFLFFYSTLRMIKKEHVEVPSYNGPIDFLVDEMAGLETFKQGDLVINNSSDYFGLVLGQAQNLQTNDKFLSTLPFDDTEQSSALPASVAHVRCQWFGESFGSFLAWLMTTDGMVYAGMFMFPDMEVSGEGKLSLVPHQTLDYRF